MLAPIRANDLDQTAWISKCETSYTKLAGIVQRQRSLHTVYFELSDWFCFVLLAQLPSS